MYAVQCCGHLPWTFEHLKSERSDLQALDSNATAKDILALVVKQLRAVGVPFVHDVFRMLRLLVQQLAD